MYEWSVGRRTVDYSGSRRPLVGRTAFLDKQRAEREARERNRRQRDAARRIEAAFCASQCRHFQKDLQRDEFDKSLKDLNALSTAYSELIQSGSDDQKSLSKAYCRRFLVLAQQIRRVAFFFDCRSPCESADLSRLLDVSRGLCKFPIPTVCVGGPNPENIVEKYALVLRCICGYIRFSAFEYATRDSGDACDDVTGKGAVNAFTTLHLRRVLGWHGSFLAPQLPPARQLAAKHQTSGCSDNCGRLGASEGEKGITKAPSSPSCKCCSWRLPLVLPLPPESSPQGQRVGQCVMIACRLLMRLAEAQDRTQRCYASLAADDRNGKTKRLGPLERVMARLSELGEPVGAILGQALGSEIECSTNKNTAETERPIEGDELWIIDLIEKVCRTDAFSADPLQQLEFAIHFFGRPLVVPLPAVGFVVESTDSLRFKVINELSASPALSGLSNSNEIMELLLNAKNRRQKLLHRRELYRPGRNASSARAARDINQNVQQKREEDERKKQLVQQRRHERVLELQRLEDLGVFFRSSCASAGLERGARLVDHIPPDGDVDGSVESQIPNVSRAVAVAGNVLACARMRRNWSKDGSIIPVAQWVVVLLRLCSTASPYELLKQSVLSLEEQNLCETSVHHTEVQICKQMRLLVDKDVIDMFFITARNGATDGLEDFLQIFFPRSEEDRVPGVRHETDGSAAYFDADGDDSESETSDVDDTEDSPPNDGKADMYTTTERLVLNALSLSTSLSSHLLPTIKSAFTVEHRNSPESFVKALGSPPDYSSPMGQIVRAACIVLRYKLQMTDDSELVEDSGGILPSVLSYTSTCKSMGATNEPASSPLSLADLRWLFSAFNRMSWMFLKEAYAKPTGVPRSKLSTPSLGNDTPDRSMKKSTLHPIVRNKNRFGGSFRGSSLRLLLPALVQQLVDLNSRVKFLAPQDLLVRDSPSLLMLLQNGMQLVALHEYLLSGQPATSDPDQDTTLSPAIGSSLPAHGTRLPFHSSDMCLLAAVLTEMPHVLNFQDRVVVFYNLLRMYRPVSEDFHYARQTVTIRREYIVEDGLSALMNCGDVHRNFRVEFRTSEGTVEEGVGSGLFKEFVVELSRKAFSPDYGLFKACEDNSLYPNPCAERVHANVSSLFTALGTLVGKAMIENVLIEPLFNRVFLHLLLGRPSRLDDVKSLDPEMHRSLLFLKYYEGDVQELALTFSATLGDLGGNTEVDLIPGGRDIAVTNESKLRYIHAIADFKCSRQMERHTEAFIEGFSQIIPLQLLHMFNPDELQLLICGTSEGFDAQDLRLNTKYSGGYTEDTRCIKWLWEIVMEMTCNERSAFLMFVTSCSRAPLLGFQSLNPPFTVHRVRELDRLPTSSTCINLFKLPEYASKEELKTKLQDAVKGARGFGFS